MEGLSPGSQTAKSNITVPRQPSLLTPNLTSEHCRFGVLKATPRFDNGINWREPQSSLEGNYTHGYVYDKGYTFRTR